MNAQQALQFLDQITSNIPGTRQTHAQIQSALLAIQKELNAPGVGLVTQNLKDATKQVVVNTQK